MNNTKNQELISSNIFSPDIIKNILSFLYTEKNQALLPSYKNCQRSLEKAYMSKGEQMAQQQNNEIKDLIRSSTKKSKSKKTIINDENIDLSNIVPTKLTF